MSRDSWLGLRITDRSTRREQKRRRPRRQPHGKQLRFELLECRQMLATHILSTGTGDASLSVGVDGYGVFGSSMGADTTNAYYDPVGPIGQAGPLSTRTWPSALGAAGALRILASGGMGGLTDPAITGDGTSGTSSFTYEGLSFTLVQRVAPLLDSSNAQTGSLLVQTYNVHNTSAGPLDFEMIRYMDGDLYFDGSRIDGGGRIVSGGSEILFETDSGGSGATATTFVGITGSGGTTPSANRYEIEHTPTCRATFCGQSLDQHYRG